LVVADDELNIAETKVILQSKLEFNNSIRILPSSSKTEKLATQLLDFKEKENHSRES